jgi:hypothetical protein
VSSIENPTGKIKPWQLISLNGGGGVISNDEVDSVASPCNVFIMQDENGVALIDVSSLTGTVIHSVNGNYNSGLFIEKK